MKNIKQILLTLILFQILFCGILLCQEVDSYSNKNNDSLRIVAKALSTGIMYKQMYEIELKSSEIKDSLYKICMNKPPQVVKIIEKETNWIVTGLISVAVLLLNWTIYLTLNK